MPTYLAPNIVRRSFVVAQHTVAFTLLSITVLMALVFQNAQPTAILWPAIVAPLPALGLLLIAERVRAFVWSLSYLVVGGLGVHLYALVMLDQPIPVHYSDGFTFLAMKVALLMVGGVTFGVGAGIAGAVAGYVTGELAVALALVESGGALHFDIPAFVMLLGAVVAVVVFGRNDPRYMWVLPSLRRAARADYVASMRYRIEVKAATLMHDTVLNHLAAVAGSEADSLDPQLRQQIQQDVEFLTAEEWLTETLVGPGDSENETRSDWLHSGLFAAIREVRLLGLDVATSGDFTAVSRLDREASIAVGLAVKQCLVNVLKHSGTTEAEVTVYRSDSEFSVMVIDSGCGFVESATSADRLGLRSSVRKRIELVGGTVTVWSTPGRGTSIMITVPMAHGSASPTVEKVGGAP